MQSLNQSALWGSLGKPSRKKSSLVMEIFRKGGEGSDPIHNFATHFLCSKVMEFLPKIRGGGWHKFHKTATLFEVFKQHFFLTDSFPIKSIVPVLRDSRGLESAGRDRSTPCPPTWSLTSTSPTPRTPRRRLIIWTTQWITFLPPRGQSDKKNKGSAYSSLSWL